MALPGSAMISSVNVSCRTPLQKVLFAAASYYRVCEDLVDKVRGKQDDLSNFIKRSGKCILKYLYFSCCFFGLFLEFLRPGLFMSLMSLALPCAPDQAFSTGS